MIPPQKQMTGMLGHPVAENPIDRMFDAVYVHYGLCWQFWKNDIANAADLALAVRALVPLGYRGMAITVPYKVAVLPLLDAVDDDVRAIGAANYLTIEAGRLIGHNNDGKGVVKAIEKLAPLAGQRVVMLGAGGAGRAMAVEMAWAGAAHLTLITRRQEQGQEVADTVHRHPRLRRAGGVAALGWGGGAAGGHHPADECHPPGLRAGAGAGARPLGHGGSGLRGGGCDHQPPHHPLPGHGPQPRLPGGGWRRDAGAAGHADLRAVDRRDPRGVGVPARRGRGPGRVSPAPLRWRALSPASP